MRAKSWLILVVFVAFGAASSVQGGEFAGLTPGQSTLADARTTLGPDQLADGIHAFPGRTYDAREIRVEVTPNGDIIRAITIVPTNPPRLEQMREWLSLPDPTFVETTESRRTEMYSPAQVILQIEENRVVELTHESPASMAALLRTEAQYETAAGRFDTAVNLYIAMLPQFQRDAAFRNELAQTLHSAGRDPDAEEVLRETLVIQPSNESAQDWHALVKATLDVGRLPVIGTVLDHLVVQSVVEGSPAATAGLEPGDVLRQVYTFKVRSPEDVQQALLYVPPGSPIDLVIYRNDKPLSLSVPFVSRDEAGALLDALTDGSADTQVDAWLDLSNDLVAHDLAKSYGAAMRARRLSAGDRCSADLRSKARETIDRRREAFMTQQQASRLFKAKRWNDALDATDHLLSLEPDLPIALYARAYILHVGLNRTEEALATLADTSTWPQSRSTSLALILRGDILSDTGQYDEAGRCYELAWTGPMSQADLHHIRFMLALGAQRLESPRAAALWHEYLAHADGIPSEEQNRQFALRALEDLDPAAQTAAANE